MQIAYWWEDEKWVAKRSDTGEYSHNRHFAEGMDNADCWSPTCLDEYPLSLDGSEQVHEHLARYFPGADIYNTDREPDAAMDKIRAAYFTRDLQESALRQVRLSGATAEVLQCCCDCGLTLKQVLETMKGDSNGN